MAWNDQKMASVKVVSLLIKTLSKPIANRLKISAQEHPKFRTVCVGLAQSLHRYETRLASGIFAKAQPVIRPLSDTKAIQNGANFLSEAFLFSVAVALIVAENLRGRMQTAHRRDVVNERLTELESLCANIRAEQETLEQKIQPLFRLCHQDSLLTDHRRPSISESSHPPSTALDRPHSSQPSNDDNDDDERVEELDRSLANDHTVRRAEIALGYRKN
ncbi:hypothetical protein PGT21_014625 [Puccinia graminis f. sp. tritici]|uniref:OPA3-domain-containing protein n=1 Tax=Puccinia graminis f. sp. tritici TaxID=56615 RepID=A0A5B0M5P7_PUCGR|nr:hypothetical protein PGT21_014625 [Puccinia graminis f. sp. tritici]